MKHDKAVEPLVKRKRLNIAHVNKKQQVFVHTAVSPFPKMEDLHILIISNIISKAMQCYLKVFVF